jgi:hypothetical protein
MWTAAPDCHHGVQAVAIDTDSDAGTVCTDGITQQKHWECMYAGCKGERRFTRLQNLTLCWVVHAARRCGQLAPAGTVFLRCAAGLGGICVHWFWETCLECGMSLCVPYGPVVPAACVRMLHCPQPLISVHDAAHRLTLCLVLHTRSSADAGACMHACMHACICCAPATWAPGPHPCYYKPLGQMEG